MVAVVALNNANITAAMINAPDSTLPPALPGGATSATVIPAHNQQQIIFSTLTQGSDSVRDYYRKIDKYASWAQISDREKRIQFIRSLSPENKLELKRLGLNRSLNDDLIKTLKQIEIEKNDMLLGKDIYNQPATKTKPKAPSYQGITTEDVDRIENITKADLQAIAKSLQETINLLRKKPYIHPADENNHDSVDDISDSLAGLTLNSETIRKILQNELKLIFPDHFFQNSIKANIPNQASLFQEKIKSQSNTSPIAEIENSHLRGLVLKKDNEAVPERSAEHVPSLMSNTKEKKTTTPTIAGSLMMPMIIYSILLIAIIWIVVGKKIWKKNNQYIQTSDLHLRTYPWPDYVIGGLRPKEVTL
ncbi:1429_t:CDS:2 [Dentiscutata heterogama]|uniref:1429_t:CDS:1 n=1 Tax=Dentiscutata heterogama TaxID=1316150 RepID=A0ACA9K5N7_9GLOM|nr:1429_t:CDS:2 [Dentiscutata heterogama]